MVSCVRLIRWVGPASFVAGVLMMALAVAQHQANVYLVLVIPVIVGTGPVAFLGIILVFAGFLLTFLLWPARLVEDPGNRDAAPTSPAGAAPARRGGGVPFLGAVPGVFGFGPRVAPPMPPPVVILLLAPPRPAPL